MAQVRFEAVPAGESWSVEKTGSKRHDNYLPNPVYRFSVRLKLFNYLGCWPNDCTYL